MTAREAVAEILRSCILATEDDAEEFIEELMRLGFEIVRKQKDK